MARLNNLETLIHWLRRSVETTPWGELEIHVVMRDGIITRGDTSRRVTFEKDGIDTMP